MKYISWTWCFSLVEIASHNFYNYRVIESCVKLNVGIMLSVAHIILFLTYSQKCKNFGIKYSVLTLTRSVGYIYLYLHFDFGQKHNLQEEQSVRGVEKGLENIMATGIGVGLRLLLYWKREQGLGGGVNRFCVVTMVAKNDIVIWGNGKLIEMCKIMISINYIEL